MNPEIFSEWLRRQGFNVYRSKNSYWFNQGEKALQAFPYHWVIDPNEEEIQEVIKTSNALTLRYSTPIYCKGKISYHAIHESKSYDFDRLGKWTRKNIKRGLSNCEVRKIPFETLAKDGYALQISTLFRQGRKLKLLENEWENRCLSAADLPGFLAWGAYVEEKLAASVITFKMNDCGYLLYQQCHHEYLSAHVNNALSYTAILALLSEPDINSILYGLHSLDAPPSVDEFKFRMGFTAKPVRQRVVFNPKIEPLFNPVTYHAINALHNLIPGNTTLSKAEGMVRFYLEGKKPLSQQQWPDVLLNQKEEIIAQSIGK